MPQNRLIGGAIGEILAKDFRDVCDISEVVKGMSDTQIKNFFENDDLGFSNLFCLFIFSNSSLV